MFCFHCFIEVYTVSVFTSPLFHTRRCSENTIVTDTTSFVSSLSVDSYDLFLLGFHLLSIKDLLYLPMTPLHQTLTSSKNKRGYHQLTFPWVPSFQTSTDHVTPVTLEIYISSVLFQDLPSRWRLTVVLTDLVIANFFLFHAYSHPFYLLVLCSFSWPGIKTRNGFLLSFLRDTPIVSNGLWAKEDQKIKVILLLLFSLVVLS